MSDPNEFNPDDPGPGNAPAGPESAEEDRKNTLDEDHVEVSVEEDSEVEK